MFLFFLANVVRLAVSVVEAKVSVGALLCTSTCNEEIFGCFIVIHSMTGISFLFLYNIAIVLLICYPPPRSWLSSSWPFERPGRMPGRLEMLC